MVADSPPFEERLERDEELLERHEEALRRLEEEVRSLRTAVVRLQGAGESVAPAAAAPPRAGASAEPEAPPAGRAGAESDVQMGREQVGREHMAREHVGREVVGDLNLVGRTLMVFGGAFLLRAFTESPALEDTTGVALGLLYALLWLGMAHRSATQASRSSIYHALAFTLVAFPLVVEAVLRFEVLSGIAGAGVLAVLGGLGLAVAAHRGLRSAAWLTSVGTVGAGWILMIGSGRVVSYSLVLLALGLATLVLSYRRPWRVLPWATAAAVDLALLVPVIQATHDRWQGPVAVALTVQIGTLMAYLGVFVPRTLRAGWRPRPFEVAQTLALVAVAYGGALRVAVAVPEAARGLGWTGLALALASFAAAGAFLRWRREGRPALLYYAALGCPLLLGASELLLGWAVESALWAALAVLVGWVSVRLESVTLSLVGTLFGVAAAVASGLLLHAVWALGMPAERPWPQLPPVALGVLAAVALAAWLPYPERSEFWRRGASLPRLALLTVVALGLAAALCEALAPLVAGGTGGPGADAGALAALRTAVLALLAVAAAWAGRRRRLRQAGWLVYPLLALGALKLLVQDLLVGRPATLFAGLAIYGAALIAAPRILKQGSGEAEESDR